MRGSDVEPRASRRDLLRWLGWSGALGAIGARSALAAIDPGELRVVPGGRSQEAVRLSSNENPWGMCPAAVDRLRQVASEVNRYPFAHEAELVSEIAALHGIPEASIVTGCGSTEILRMAAAAWVGPGRDLVQAEPTFETIAFYARAAGQEPVSIPLDAAGRHDLDAMLDAVDGNTKLVYVCNPANPSSTLLPQADFDAFLDAVPEQVFVLVDEAYHHYVDDPDYRSQASRAMASANVVVVRTFSKIYGMAGLRVGYAIGPEARIAELGAQRTDISVNCIAGACAAASLRDGGYAEDQRRRNGEARRILTDALDGMDVGYWDSQTNFVMADLGRPMMPVNREMARRGVRVGRLFPALPNHLRISVGTPAEMERCAEALRATLA